MDQRAHDAGDNSVCRNINEITNKLELFLHIKISKNLQIWSTLIWKKNRVRSFFYMYLKWRMFHTKHLKI